MQHYEMMFIVDPSAEDGVDEVKQKIEGIITGREGVVISYDKLGKKRLAYTVAKRQYGLYFLVNFRGTGKIIQALEYFLRLSPVVIRHIILAFSEKELGLRERTTVVQLEEAERMRMGGRPLAVKAGGEEVVEVAEPVAAAADIVAAAEIAAAAEVVAAAEVEVTADIVVAVEVEEKSSDDAPAGDGNEERNDKTVE